MATSFSWKRKIGESLTRQRNKAFSAEEEIISDTAEAFDWLGSAKRLKRDKNFILPLEDAIAKSKRLINEGIILAESERFWEAIKKWDEAGKLNQNNAKLHEMKAQAYLSLHELYPAVKSAELSVKINPNWWTAYQTLGRTQLGLGEVQLAIRSFSKAIHLSPDVEEVWRDDLHWALSLYKQHEKLTVDSSTVEKNKRLMDCEDGDASTLIVKKSFGVCDSNSCERTSQKDLGKMVKSTNWVQLRV